VLLPPFAARAADPEPAASKLPVRIDLTKIQPKSLLPKHAEHTEFVVAINKLGQVTRVIAQKRSDNPTFNAQTVGNALQSFIRTPDGLVVLGTYRLTYDYDPKTQRVRRDVALVRQGGVDPDAKGAAVVMMEKAQRQEEQARNRKAAPQVDPKNLPDLKSMGASTPLPQPS
jgi:hypothetical protein